MKNLKIAGVALLIAALPLAPAAFANDLGHDRHESRRPAHSKGHEYRGHLSGHERHYYRHGHYDYHRYQQSSYRHYDGYESYDQNGYRTQIILPIPPLPPLPVFVVPIQHKGHIVLRRGF